MMVVVDVKDPGKIRGDGVPLEYWKLSLAAAPQVLEMKVVALHFSLRFFLYCMCMETNYLLDPLLSSNTLSTAQQPKTS